MRYLLILLFLATPAWATDTALIDRDGTTTPVTLGSGAYSPALALTTTAPNADGVASAGSGDTAARVDHVHPTDSSRAPLDNPIFTTGITTPIVNSSAVDGQHMLLCSNSGDMDTTTNSVSAPMPNSVAWGAADKGRFCYNVATSKYRYWTGSALADWPGGSGGGITDLTGDVTASGTGSVAATVAKIQGVAVNSSAPSTGDFFRFNGTSWLHVPLVSGDIPNNGANTSGSAGSLSAVSALPNGTTATTQTAGDNSTKVATTSYVNQAVSAAGGGNVTGPGSAVNGHIAVFSGTDGKTIADGGAPGSGAVNSGTQYHLPFYASGGTAVSDSGIIVASDGSTITTAQNTGPDSLMFRSGTAIGSANKRGWSYPASAAASDLVFDLPAADPTAGQVMVCAAPVGGHSVCTWAANGAYTFAQSLSNSGGTVTLSGDSVSPGNSMLYGTNSSGVKGWYAQPAESNLAAPGPIGNVTPSTGAFTTASITSDNPWLTQTDSGAAISSSNPAWREGPLHTDGLWHAQSSADGTTFGDAATLSRAGNLSVVGSIAVGTGGTISGRLSAKTYVATIPAATADAATVTFDLQAGDSPSVTLGGNRTLAFSNPVAGQWYRLNLIQDATGGRTVTWPSSGLQCTWRNTASNAAPTLLTGANKVDSFVIHVLSSTSAECWTANNQ